MKKRYFPRVSHSSGGPFGSICRIRTSSKADTAVMGDQCTATTFLHTQPSQRVPPSTYMTSRSSTQTPTTTAAALVPTLAALADPPIRQIDASVMDYLLIEMVNTLRSSSAVATARSKKIEQEMIEAGLLPPPPPPLPVLSVPTKNESPRDSVTSLGSRAAGKLGLDEEEEGVRIRLEGIGIHVGANFTERYVCHILDVLLC